MATVKLNGLTMSKGNSKLSKSIAIWNLPAIETCPNCEGCKKTCYAMKAQRMYPSVRACRSANLEASKSETFVEDMVNLIIKSKCATVRIHESGDYYSQEYADKWSAIIEALPEVKFYGYSKSPYRPKAAWNLNIVESIMPDGHINFGPEVFAATLAKKHKAPICPATMGKDVVCGESCRLCMTCKLVVFVQH